MRTGLSIQNARSSGRDAASLGWGDVMAAADERYTANLWVGLENALTGRWVDSAGMESFDSA